MAKRAKLSPYRIGMFGAGTVGGGVYELVMNRRPRRSGAVISKICVRDAGKSRDFAIDGERTAVVTDPASILEDADIDCVVEVMGGTGLARTVVLDALRAGKSVVTANKALVAEHMAELEELCAAKDGEGEVPAPFLAYEAAVCGGIPIINALQTAYRADAVSSVAGICNGTTNYMLTEMAGRGADYAASLRRAQDLGFAEADPTADVEGHDVRAKIAILARLAFGVTVSADSIPCQGISQLTLPDMEYAANNQYVIKLLGTATKSKDGALSVYVTPTLVPRRHFLASIQGAGNAVTVTSNNLGACSYTGPGAGRFPTANSVVADIYRVEAGTATQPPFPDSSPGSDEKTELQPDYEASFYLRVKSKGQSPVGRLGADAIALQHGVLLLSSKQTSNLVYLMTDQCKLSQIQAVCKELSEKPECDGMLFMPVLEA